MNLLRVRSVTVVCVNCDSSFYLDCTETITERRIVFV